jgi:hypothetical protein
LYLLWRRVRMLLRVSLGLRRPIQRPVRRLRLKLLLLWLWSLLLLVWRTVERRAHLVRWGSLWVAIAAGERDLAFLDRRRLLLVLLMLVAIGL